MAVRRSSALDYTGRFGLQQADQAIKRDVVRALAELITNADDSYRRLEQRGVKTDGQISIQIKRKHQGSEIEVVDHAEGMTGDKLDEALGTYGEDVSGFAQGAPVRGFFGRGLKDAILGLGEGSVYSIVGDRFNGARLEWKANKPWYECDQDITVTPETRKSMDIPTGNGTVVVLRVTRVDVTMPRLDSARKHLSFYFSLRDIMASEKRTVRLLGTKFSETLSYRFPKGNVVKEETFSLPKSFGSARLTVSLSEKVLDQPGETGPLAQAGILICGKNAIYDNALFKFDGNPAASRLFGRVVCEGLDELLRKDASIARATRDGLDPIHHFFKALKKEVEDRLQPIIDAEVKKEAVGRRSAEDQKLRAKVDRLMSELRTIVKEELRLDDGNTEGREVTMPEGGFGFVPDIFNVVSGEKRWVTIRSKANYFERADIEVAVSSSSPEVEVIPDTVRIIPRNDDSTVLEGRIQILGRQVGSEAMLTAKANGLEGQALTHVVAQYPERPRTSRPPASLFKDIVPDYQKTPPFRVRYDPETHNVIYYLEGPSIKKYVGLSGNLNETLQGQVLLAELVTEAVTQELANRGVRSKVYAAVEGGEAEAIARYRIRLTNRYAHTIHDILVDQ
jgi:hypothetical protein